MVDIAGLTILVLIAWGALALGLILLKAMLWLVFLPIRLLFYALLLPLFFVLKAALGGVLLLVLAPLLAIAALLTLVAAVVAIAVPLLPLVLVAFVIWFVARLMRAAPSPTRA